MSSAGFGSRLHERRGDLLLAVYVAAVQRPWCSVLELLDAERAVMAGSVLTLSGKTVVRNVYCIY